MAFEDILKQKPGANVAEQDFRLAILNSLLSTPHRDLQPFIPLFTHVAKVDPRFFGQLAAWYSDQGSGRDFKQMFSAFLCVSEYQPNREVGLALLMDLPPYQVERVFRTLKGGEVREYKEETKTKPGKGGKQIKHKTVTKRYQAGIVKSIPTSFRTAVKDYLKEREADQNFFDSAVLQSRKSLRTLYGSLRIKPGPYADAVLFKNEPPEGSKFHTLKQIANEKDPTEQAKLIVINKLPFRVATSLIHEMTAPVIAALITAMTPQELINNLGALQRKGAMDNPDIKKLVEEKLQKAKGDKRVSALKTGIAVEAAGLDDDLAQKVKDVGDVRIKAKGQIKKSTALLVDKSGSMDQAIEVGKRLAAVIAPVCQDKLIVMAFDSFPMDITAKGNELSDWERAFDGIHANGQTSVGCCVARLISRNESVEQIVIVTDQGENFAPRLVPELARYEKQIGTVPNIIILNVGKWEDHLVNELKKAGREVETLTFNGDYYSLENIIPMLAGGSRLDLLMEIMDYTLPSRKQKELVKA